MSSALSCGGALQAGAEALTSLRQAIHERGRLRCALLVGGSYRCVGRGGGGWVSGAAFMPSARFLALLQLALQGCDLAVIARAFKVSQRTMLIPAKRKRTHRRAAACQRAQN